MLKFEEETNIFVWYNEEFVKSGIRESETLYESFHGHKWKNPEILLDLTWNSLKTMFFKAKVYCNLFVIFLSC